MTAAGTIGAAVLTGAVIWGSWPVPLWSDVRVPLLAFAATAVVVMLVRNPPQVARLLLGNRPMVALGRISYGVYLWHFLVIWTIERDHNHLSPVVVFALAMGGTLVLSVASYRLVELPFLRLKRRLR